ncbi:MAG TPA: CHASE2 domain-containing protein [Armatimonadota bacterium]|jgi:two-component system phosphate regulon sensor histidine kinase PhoR
MHKRTRNGLLALLGILALLALIPQRLERLNFQLQDACYTGRGARAPRPEIVLVTIDEASLLSVAPWPWSAGQIARLVDCLSTGRPRVLGLDLESLTHATLAPLPSADSSALQSALQRAGNVVLPAVVEAVPQPLAGALPTGPEVYRFGAGTGRTAMPARLREGVLVTPRRELLPVAAGLGTLNVTPETDHILRRGPLVASGDDHLYPSFAAELARVYQGAAPGGAYYTVADGQVHTPTRAAELATGAEYPINYAGGYGTYPSLSARRALAASPAELAQWLEGKLVIVGLVTSTTAGTLATPTGWLPGPELQANMAASLLPGGGLTVVAGGWGWLVALLGGLAMVLGLARRRARSSLLITAGAILASWVAAQLLFDAGVLLPLAAPLATWALTGAAIVLLSAHAAERAQAEAHGRGEAQIRTLHNLGEMLASGLDRRRLLNEILLWVQRELGVEAASLLLMDADHQRLHFEAALGGAPEAIKDFTVELGQGIAGTVALTGKPLIANDARRDPRQAREIAQAVGFPTRDILCVPMVRQGRVVGVIEALNRQGGRPFAPVDADLLSVIAQEAALFLENARLYGELQERVDFANAELRATNESLAAEKARTDTLVHEMASGVVATDAEERIILVNELAEEMLGVRQEQVRGLSVFEAPLPEPIAAMFREPLPSREGPLAREVELPPGSGRQARAHLAPFDREGETIGKVLVLTDVTQFVELDKLKNDLISFVSHELKNPLAAVMAFTHLLQTQPAAGQEPLSRYVWNIEHQAQAMQSLVQDYLSVARLEAGRPLDVEWEPLDDVGEQITELVAVEALARNREITVDLPADLPVIWADRQKLRQILLNLVSNAAKYTPTEATITVSAQPQGNFVAFSVADTGEGLSEDAQEHVFEKFRRLRGPDAARVPGTGIGLYLARKLAEAHGGQLGVESEPGHGATFTFTLPTYPPAEEDSPPA